MSEGRKGRDIRMAATGGGSPANALWLVVKYWPFINLVVVRRNQSHLAGLERL